MQYRRLGNSGLTASIVGLGCNNFGRRCDLDQTKAVVHEALDSGITLFDTADIYGPRGLSEEYLGAALQGRRDGVLIATKFGGSMADDDTYMKGASRRYIMNAVEASLKRLGADYIDLYQIHMPDADTPLEETIRALDDLIAAGTVRYVGHSNFAGWQIASAEWIARANGLNRFITAQNHYSLLKRDIEAEVVPASTEFGLSILPYFPLASGLLTGKYARGKDSPAGSRLSGESPTSGGFVNEKNMDRVERLRSLADASGHSMIELAISWLANRPYVGSVIAGATSPVQVKSNAAAAGWLMSDDELSEIDAITSEPDA